VGIYIGKILFRYRPLVYAAAIVDFHSIIDEPIYLPTPAGGWAFLFNPYMYGQKNLLLC
jgi:hypothetical protein